MACAVSCPPGQFLCSEGRCIDEAFLCDGHEDCGQAEDEDDGVCKCSSEQYQCQYGGGCINASFRCDGRYQCPDRSDEWDCVSINNSTLQIRYFSTRQHDNKQLMSLFKMTPLMFRRNSSCANKRTSE